MKDLPTTATQSRAVMSPLMDPTSFEHLQRVGNMLASSVLFPEHLRKGTAQQAAANGALVMNMAMRLNEDPLTVAQNIYFVGGKPGWSSSYMIGKANQHGVFKSAISWKVTGKGDDLSVTAFATLKESGEKVQATCDMHMAKAEGWTKNAKYKSMPEQMLQYRSATFLIRLYCPEVMVGVPSQIEIELGGGEMKDITPREFQAAAPAEGEVVEDEADEAEVVTDQDQEQETAPEDENQDAERERMKFDSAEDAFPILKAIRADLDDGAPVEATRELYMPELQKLDESGAAALEALFLEFSAP